MDHKNTCKDMIKGIQTWIRTEIHLQVLFFQAWEKDTNLVRKAAMIPLYFTLLIPMRVWNHFPYPTFLAMILSGMPLVYNDMYPGYISETQFMLYYAVLFGPLCEAFILNAIYYWVPGGAQSLTNFFYGKQHIATFFGNPISSLRACLGGIAVGLGLQTAKVIDTVYNNWKLLAAAKTEVEVTRSAAEAAQNTADAAKSAAEASKSAAEASRVASDEAAACAAKAMSGAQEEIKTLRENGADPSPEQVREIVDRYNKLHNVSSKPDSPGTNISGSVRVNDGQIQTGVTVSHRSDGINVNGEGSIKRSLGDTKKSVGLPSTGFISPEKE